MLTIWRSITRRSGNCRVCEVKWKQVSDSIALASIHPCDTCDSNFFCSRSQFTGFATSMLPALSQTSYGRQVASSNATPRRVAHSLVLFPPLLNYITSHSAPQSDSLSGCADRVQSSAESIGEPDRPAQESRSRHKQRARVQGDARSGVVSQSRRRRREMRARWATPLQLAAMGRGRGGERPTRARWATCG